MKQFLELLILILVGRRLLLSYIDPNSGGMLFQALAVGFGLLSGLLLFFSGQIRSAWARLRRHRREGGAGAIDTTSEDAEGQEEGFQNQSINEDLGKLE